MYRIRKRFTFEAAHQLEYAVTAACHECIHGHSYTVELVVASEDLNAHQMVLDFAEFKDFKDRVMAEWDHGLLLHVNKREHYLPLIEKGLLKKEKVHFFEDNPTAETMARVLFIRLSRYVATRTLWAERVRVHETSSGWAEYCGDFSGYELRKKD